jgi:hypothetical protein
MRTVWLSYIEVIVQFRYDRHLVVLLCLIVLMFFPFMFQFINLVLSSAQFGFDVGRRIRQKIHDSFAEPGKSSTNERV